MKQHTDFSFRPASRTQMFFCYLAAAILTVVLLLGGNSRSYAQSFTEKPYELRFAPDFWYNDVDGIRLGVRMRGQVPGTFDDGPHRLDTGLWLGTWLPDTPVSYYIKYTNPIASISDFNSEGSYSLLSSIRAGFHRHGLGFDKRWQPGFNEDEFTQFAAFGGVYRHFDDEYLVFPALWQDGWTPHLAMSAQRQQATEAGFLYYRASAFTGLADGEDLFSSLQAEVRKSIALSRQFNIRLRVSGGYAAGEVPPEQRYLASQATAFSWMNSGFFRAKGTIPVPWMESGAFQLTGNAANIRGYAGRDARNARNGTPVFYEAYTAINAEIDYPNPIDRIFESIPILGDFLRLRSYLFTDVFSGARYSDDRTENLADAGAGFALSLNIPDQLGRPRGFVLRCDLPVWLSSPEPGEDPLKLRGVVSFGAVIGF
ncbi:MAG: hypothetical protein JJU35_03405 [Balneolales bacterium]|nr:hypothetical protein [Balneolales bacterium]